jgi:ribosomal protein S8
MDRISNLLIALKNGGNAKRPTATVPFSKLQASIAKVLFDAGYIASYSKKAQVTVMMYSNLVLHTCRTSLELMM